MKKLLLTCAVAAMVFGLNPSAIAAPTITVEGGPYQAGPGGEFTIIVGSEGFAGYAPGDTFQSFCLERNEYISFGQTYYVDVSDVAVNGGMGGPSPDPLGARTAWLYNAFLDGTLTGYDFSDTGIGREESAYALQKAIWYLEGELSRVRRGTLERQFVKLATASDWYKTGCTGDIHILNIYTHPDLTGDAQDQIIRIAAIPAPGAIPLCGIGTLVIGWLRRRKTL